MESVVWVGITRRTHHRGPQGSCISTTLRRLAGLTQQRPSMQLFGDKEQPVSALDACFYIRRDRAGNALTVVGQEDLSHESLTFALSLRPLCRALPSFP